MAAKSGRVQGAAVGSSPSESFPPTVGPGGGGVDTTPTTSHRCSPGSPLSFPTIWPWVYFVWWPWTSEKEPACSSTVCGGGSAQAGVSPGLVMCLLSSSTGNLTDGSVGHGCSPCRVQTWMLPTWEPVSWAPGARRGLPWPPADLQQAQHSAWQLEDRVELWGGEVTADPLGYKLSVPLSAHWLEGSCDTQLAGLLWWCWSHTRAPCNPPMISLTQTCGPWMCWQRRSLPMALQSGSGWCRSKVHEDSSSQPPRPVPWASLPRGFSSDVTSSQRNFPSLWPWKSPASPLRSVTPPALPVEWPLCLCVFPVPECAEGMTGPSRGQEWPALVGTEVPIAVSVQAEPAWPSPGVCTATVTFWCAELSKARDDATVFSLTSFGRKCEQNNKTYPSGVCLPEICRPIHPRSS